jgi:hypothetical protein
MIGQVPEWNLCSGAGKDKVLCKVVHDNKDLVAPATVVERVGMSDQRIGYGAIQFYL